MFLRSKTHLLVRHRDLLTRHHRLCHQAVETAQDIDVSAPMSSTSRSLPQAASLTYSFGGCRSPMVTEVPNDGGASVGEDASIDTGMQFPEAIHDPPVQRATESDIPWSSPSLLGDISADLFDNYDWSAVFHDDNFADIDGSVIFPEPAHSLSYQQPLVNHEHAHAATPTMVSAGPDNTDTSKNSANDENGHLSRFGSRLPSLEPDEQQPQQQQLRLHSQRNGSDHASPWSSGTPRRCLFEVNAERRQAVFLRLAEFSNVVPSGFELPSRHALTRFVAMYVAGFNEHNPVLHLPTLSVDSMAVELFLSIVAIGARYGREKETSLELFRVAQAITFERIKRDGDGLSAKAVRANPATTDGLSSVAAGPSPQVTQNEDAGDKTQIEVMQALVLMIASILFGRIPGARSRELALFRSALEVMIRDRNMMIGTGCSDGSWERWVKEETLKRIILVSFTLLNLQTMILDSAPSFWWSEIHLRLPCAEETWNAKSSALWRQARGREEKSTEAPVQETIRNLFHHSDMQDFRPCFSSLGGYFLIHAILQSVWLLRQMTPMYALPGTDQHFNSEHIHRALRQWRRGWERNVESSMNPVNPTGPIAFTSTALLRLAYVRISMPTRLISSLNTWDPGTIAKAFTQAALIERSERATRAALHCAHALSIPVKIGLNFVAHTQSFYWACQHALSSLECALFLSKWLQTVTGSRLHPPLTRKEALVLEFVNQVVAETEFRAPRCDLLSEGHRRLSGIVVRIWAKMFPRDSVWEMVDLVGKSLHACADECEN